MDTSLIDLALGIPREAWAVLGEMAPYLIFGFAMAGVLSVFIPPETVERHLGKQSFWSVFKATVLGIPLPLCSCSVIPVAASLRKHGATRGATAAFLLSTPQTGVDSIMVTLGLLGPVVAIFRPIAALVAGLVGGSLVAATDAESREGGEAPEPCRDACCAPGGSESKTVRALRYAFVTLPRDIGKALLVGLLIVGVISAFVPDDFFAGVIGTGIGAMFVMMLLGLPMYVCATASVPIAAALIAKGVTPGAAFVFLMTGPATNAASIATIWKIMGRRTALIYMGTVVVCALLAGLALDGLISAAQLDVEPGMGRMLPGSVKTISAFVLLGLLGWPLLTSKHRHAHHTHDASHAHGSEEIVLSVHGMTCAHCAASAEAALLACPGVTGVHVDLPAETASAAGEGLKPEALVAAIEKCGFSARVQSSES